MKKMLLLNTLIASNILMAQNVGIGTPTPLQKLHVEGTTFLNGNVGIGTSTPFAPLTFAGNSSGEIISFNGTASNNYGIGVTLGLLQVHSNLPVSDIAFGHGSSNSFTEKMRIINNVGYDGMILNGRLVLKNGSADLIGGGGGVWLYKADNTALLGFMGAQNNQNIGFYGGPANGGWGFVYNAINSQVGIGTSNPSQKLHVEGTTFLNGDVDVVGDVDVAGNVKMSGSIHSYANLLVEGTSSLVGNVGIGTLAGIYTLEVNGTAAKPGGGSWSATSDARLKENVLPYTDGLSTLLKINPVKYHYNQLSGYDTKPEYIGVLAQDIKSIAPYMVGSFQKKEESYYNVDNSAITYMLVNAVKEQQQQLDELKKLVERLLNK